MSHLDGRLWFGPLHRDELTDFAIWYTLGIVAPCQAISRQPELVYDYTNKANSIAIISAGTPVIGADARRADPADAGEGFDAVTGDVWVVCRAFRGIL